MKNTEQNKALIVDQLRKAPIVEAACQAIGISRMTFYRWKSDDKEFAKKVDEAMNDGQMLVNDLAESQLVGAVKDRNLAAITYWLKHHHPSYKNRLDITAHIEKEEAMTPEQQEIVTRALELAQQGLIPPEQEIILKPPPEKLPEAPQVEKPATNDTKQN